LILFNSSIRYWHKHIYRLLIKICSSLILKSNFQQKS